MCIRDRENSLVTPRKYFTMTVVRDTVYAVGGTNEGFVLATVESYSEGGGWREEPMMILPRGKWGHCSVTLDDKDLVVIGGQAGQVTSEVLSFDVENLAGGWTTLPSMNTERRGHACDTGIYEGQRGIFVTGGYHVYWLSSVEFYVAQEQQWRVLGSMTTTRRDHSLSIVAGIPYAAGGYPDTASVERLDGTTWEEAGSMKGWRYYHAAVNIPAGVVTCKME